MLVNRFGGGNQRGLDHHFNQLDQLLLILLLLVLQRAFWRRYSYANFVVVVLMLVHSISANPTHRHCASQRSYGADIYARFGFEMIIMLHDAVVVRLLSEQQASAV